MPRLRRSLEGLIGLTRAGEELVLNPCFPGDWPAVTVVIRLPGGALTITIDNGAGTGRGIVAALLDGVPLTPVAGILRLRPPPGARQLTLSLG
jgi:cyclic beta-1,2-glucan synthetase